jgi:hypothetical protein
MKFLCYDPEQKMYIEIPPEKCGHTIDNDYRIKRSIMDDYEVVKTSKSLREKVKRYLKWLEGWFDRKNGNGILSNDGIYLNGYHDFPNKTLPDFLTKDELKQVCDEIRIMGLGHLFC